MKLSSPQLQMPELSEIFSVDQFLRICSKNWMQNLQLSQSLLLGVAVESMLYTIVRISRIPRRCQLSKAKSEDKREKRQTTTGQGTAFLPPRVSGSLEPALTFVKRQVSQKLRQDQLSDSHFKFSQPRPTAQESSWLLLCAIRPSQVTIVIVLQRSSWPLQQT